MAGRGRPNKLNTNNNANTGQQTLPGTDGVVTRRFAASAELRDHPAMQAFKSAFDMTEDQTGTSGFHGVMKARTQRIQGVLGRVNDYKDRVDALKKLDETITAPEDLDTFQSTMSVFRDFQLQLPGKFADIAKTKDALASELSMLKAEHADLNIQSQRSKADFDHLSTRFDTLSADKSRVDEELRLLRQQFDAYRDTHTIASDTHVGPNEMARNLTPSHGLYAANSDLKEAREHVQLVQQCLTDLRQSKNAHQELFDLKQMLAANQQAQLEAEKDKLTEQIQKLQITITHLQAETAELEKLRKDKDSLLRDQEILERNCNILTRQKDELLTALIRNENAARRYERLVDNINFGPGVFKDADVVDDIIRDLETSGATFNGT